MSSTWEGTLASDMADAIASAVTYLGEVAALVRKPTRAQLLRDLRHLLGDVSQEQLARRVGVSWSTISRWENGRGTPSPLARDKLAALLKEAGLEGRMGELA